jgi:hypothetical protein
LGVLSRKQAFSDANPIRIVCPWQLAITGCCELNTAAPSQKTEEKKQTKRGKKTKKPRRES